MKSSVRLTWHFCARTLPAVRLNRSWFLCLLGLCLSLSVAKDKKDPLALHLFHSAGVQLGKHIKALLPLAEPVLVQNYVP